MLALIGLLLRSFVAPGFMLDPAAMAQGGLKLVICTPSGAKSITVPGKHPAPGKLSNGDICPCTPCGPAGKPADPVALARETLRPIFHPWGPNRAVACVRPPAFAARAPPAVA